MRLIGEFVVQTQSYANSDYRFTYSMSFSTLLATLAAEFDYWSAFESRGVHAGLVFLAVPITLVAVNMLRIEVGSITTTSLTRTLLICV